MHESGGEPEAGSAALVCVEESSLPALVELAGRQGVARTIEFLTARVRNPHTRRAYTRAIRDFASWCAEHGVALPSLQSVHVAAYVEALSQHASAPTVKVHLAGIKHWLDWLVTGQVLPFNPAAPVRGPRYTQGSGKTPVLGATDARALLDSIVPPGLVADDVVRLRDRALVGVMLFAFARVGAVVKMRVADYERAGTRLAAFCLHEKGGKFHRVPAHHQAAEHMEAYMAAAGLEPGSKAPLFQSARGRTGRLSGEPMSENDALRMVKRRCREAALPSDICNHSFRATGITLHQDAGGDLEAARQIAGHASLKTTQLYNRSGDKRRQSEVERVQV